jgi:flagellin
MAMVVKNNMGAVSTLNTLNKNSQALQKSLSRVSSGMKINSAQDDASGYAISERMRVQIRSLDQANQNTQNGSSMMKTAEGAVGNTVEILKSLKEKAINAANDTNKDADRVTIQKEIDQFIDQIDDNALTTFNGKYLVDGSKAQEGKATFTAMTNQSLDKDTTGKTALTDLKNRNGESLEISSTDYVTASFVRNGETYTTKFNVGSDSKLVDIFNKLNSEYQNVNQDATITAFGAANTDTSKAMTVEDAKTLLNKLDGNNGLDENVIFKAAQVAGDSTKDSAVSNLTLADGTTQAKYSDVVKAIKTLSSANELSSGAGVTSAVIKDALDLDTAKAAVETDIKTAYAKLNTDLNGVVYTSAGSVAKKGDTLGGTLTLLDGTKSITATVETTQTAAGAITISNNKNKFHLVDSEDTFVNDALAKADTLIDAAVTKGKYVVDTVGESLYNGTSYAASPVGSQTTDGTGYTVTVSTNLTSAYDATNFGTKGVGYTAGETYALAKAIDKLTSQTGAEVKDSADVGVNSAGDMVRTADGEKGLTITASSSGVSGQISGVTISIADSEGNVKKAANAALDDFRTTIYAKNPSDRNELSFQVGAAANQAIAVGLEDMRSEALGLKGSDGSKVSVATQDKANAAVAVFDNAIQKALDQQTTIGAIEARLEYTSTNLTTMSENVQGAESTIRDADMAKEMTNYTKNNVLLQAAQSMLAQANQSSSAVLSLLQ